MKLLPAPIQDIWVYLAASPLLGLTITLLAYMLAMALHRRCRMHPLTNPVLVATALLVTLLLLTDTPYTTYFAGAQFVHFLLGPATVALAIPLYAQLGKVRAMRWPVLLGLGVGSACAVASAVGIAHWLGASGPTQLSLAPKSVTTPIAMGVAERIGGIASLTAVLVIVTGIVGAVLAPPLFRWVRIQDHAIQGFALGVVAHGIGTARAFAISEQAGAFAALAMGLNGTLTALLLPALVLLWGG